MSILVVKTNPAMEFAEKALKEKGCVIADTPNDDVRHLLLPIPSFPSGSKYITPVLAALPKAVTVSGGNLEHLVMEDYRTVDFLKDPCYLAKNAAITAKCAVELVDQDWQGLPVLVLGWGRIGKCLGKRLGESGADVTIAARKESDLAMIQALGSNSVPIDKVSENLLRYRVIFNTVPEMILPELQCHPDCVAVELASKPGMAGGNILSARGLPGKYAPEESGKLIAETFIRLSPEKEDTL